MFGIKLCAHAGSLSVAGQEGSTLLPKEALAMALAMQAHCLAEAAKVLA